MVFFPSEIETAKGRGEQILLVDTERRVSGMVHSILTDAGFQVTVAPDDAEAVKLFRSEIDKIALIVTELAAAANVGPSVAKEFWALNPRVPVLFCGRSNPRSVGLDVDKSEYRFAFLSKPFTPQELLWHVYRLIHHAEPLA